jgi:hypothetical protein
MLMEDDIVDNLYHQYPNHPMLLTAEQPFAQILSTNATSDALTRWPCNSVQPSPLQSLVTTPEYYSYCDMIASEMLPANNVDSMHARQDASSSLINRRMYEVAVEPNRLLPAERMSTTTSSSSMDVISMAFFKGMEEANKLLPSKNDSKTLDPDWARKKRLQGKDDMDVGKGRSSKQKAVQSQTDSEEAAASEMLDRLMLNDEPMPACSRSYLVPWSWRNHNKGVVLV